jgi:serine protease AprX
MKRTTRSTQIILGAAAVLCAGLGFASGAGAGVLAPDLEARLAAARPSDEIAVIMTFTDKVDLARYRSRGHADGVARAALITALHDKAGKTQKNAIALLASSGVREHTSLWLINGVSFSARRPLISLLASLPEVDTIRLDTTLRVPAKQGGTAAPPEWNLTAVRAPEMWSLGFTGAGVVVAGMDTGVDVDHPDLAGSYRGGENSWYDPNGEHPTPYDADGHGTQTMGIVVGGSSGGTAIGMAPDAKWIAVKIFNDSGVASLSAIHEGFQWLLDPDGDPGTNDAPDVVNDSWGSPAYLNQCYQEFAQDIAVLKTADIAVVFSAGNSGPASPSSVSPADNPGSFAVGAVDSWAVVAGFSSRGPAACDGSVFPEAVAPGVNIRTADLTFGGVVLDSYAYVSGTSFAAPHVAGALALLLGVDPQAKVDALELAVEGAAVDLGPAGADDAYGFGLIDVVAASALVSQGSGPAAVDDAFTTTQGTPLAVAAPGVLVNDSGTNLAATLAAGPEHGTASLSADGSFVYAPNATFTGSDAFTYQASDGTTNSNIATVTIAVTQPTNQAPVAVDDSASTRKNAPVTITVMANDYDPDGTIDAASVAVVTPPASGNASVNADGTVRYTPRKNFRGTDGFSYTLKDNNGATSNTATVTVTVR